jgi:hypothetical protein
MQPAIAGGAQENVHFRTLAAGYPHEEQVCFWIWRDRRPEDTQVSFSLSKVCPKFPNRCFVCGPIQVPEEGSDVPQRLHSVCVLLWRFPKLEVPFAVVCSQYRNSGCTVARGVRRTHRESGTTSDAMSVSARMV